MTSRSELDHRRREAQAALLGRVAGRALTRRTTGLDGLAKKLVAGRAPTVGPDPELDHDDPDWQVPGPSTRDGSDRT
ncbi:hypothetical protein [Dermatobacter hominis]|uniref:hypothetical protein n=1 Tax=Dermatobacter hominis TaxID=2884263 RepID=UPI001D105DBE|nr:hypothetical protein [Dermatobacter hominis]UDY35148.1 hypothetical protein LH044_17630 [Dermatobacter hominis]